LRNMAASKKRETGLSISIKKKDDLGMWYQEVLTVSFVSARDEFELAVYTRSA
jgi:hypothetical protein